MSGDAVGPFTIEAGHPLTRPPQVCEACEEPFEGGDVVYLVAIEDVPPGKAAASVEAAPVHARCLFGP